MLMINTRLKIGILSYRSNPYCGGQGVYVRNLSKALCELGHDVEVIAGPPAPFLTSKPKLTMIKTMDFYNPENLFRTPKLHELKDPVNLIEWLSISTMGYPEPLTFGMRIKKNLLKKTDKYDILHDNQSLSYAILSLARKLPVTATIHHPITIDRRIAIKSTRSFLKKLKHMRWYSFIEMQKYVAKRLLKIITVSKSSKNDISKDFSIPKNKFKVIPIGINTEIFHPIDTIKKEPNRLIVTNSSDIPLKGLYYLLYAIKNISKKRNIKLTIIGSPKKNGGIEKLIKNLYLQNHVKFTGRIHHIRFVKEYARAGIAVVPSIYEGFGLPVGEAMACRTPVICTTGGALPEVAGNAAKLVPPADSMALEVAIKELLDDPKECERLAHAGYKRVLKHFTWEKTGIKTVEAYREIINDYNRF